MWLLRSASKSFFCCAIAIGILAIPSFSSAGVLVPAYFYPGTGGPGGVGDGWGTMATAASQIPLTAVFNPNSGPLPGPADPNYINAITNLEAAGGTVIAYVHTSYGGQPLATVEGEINTYISQYGSLVKGFFVDEMSNSVGQVAYYHSLYSYIKGLDPSYQVIGNPGAPTIPNYLSPATQGADAVITYENDDASAPYTSTTPAPWTSAFPASDFISIIYNQPSAAAMMIDVDYAAANHVGTVYVTDQTTPNPYSQLPSYWDQEVAEIGRVLTPVPGTLTLTISLLGGVAVISALRRRMHASNEVKRSAQ